MLSFNQNCGLSLASENWFMLLGSKISVFHLIPYTEFQSCVTFVFSHYCFSVSHMVLLFVQVANFAVGCFDATGGQNLPLRNKSGFGSK